MTVEILNLRRKIQHMLIDGAEMKAWFTHTKNQIICNLYWKQTAYMQLGNEFIEYIKGVWQEDL